MTGFLDKFKEEDSEGSEMVEERPLYEESEPETVESGSDNEYRSGTNEVQENAERVESSTGDDIGISSLMDKRAKLEEAVDYVGMMIANLKEKLVKVNEYIEEETRGIQNLSNKRSSVEREADEVASLITTLRDKLGGIDRVVEDEGSRIKSFKDSRDKSSSF